MADMGEYVCLISDNANEPLKLCSSSERKQFCNQQEPQQQVFDMFIIYAFDKSRD